MGNMTIVVLFLLMSSGLPVVRLAAAEQAYPASSGSAFGAGRDWASAQREAAADAAARNASFDAHQTMSLDFGTQANTIMGFLQQNAQKDQMHNARIQQPEASLLPVPRWQMYRLPPGEYYVYAPSLATLFSQYQASLTWPDSLTQQQANFQNALLTYLAWTLGYPDTNRARVDLQTSGVMAQLVSRITQAEQQIAPMLQAFEPPKGTYYALYAVCKTQMASVLGGQVNPLTDPLETALKPFLALKSGWFSSPNEFLKKQLTAIDGALQALTTANQNAKMAVAGVLGCDAQQLDLWTNRSIDLIDTVDASGLLILTARQLSVTLQHKALPVARNLIAMLQTKRSDASTELLALLDMPPSQWISVSPAIAQEMMKVALSVEKKKRDTQLKKMQEVRASLSEDNGFVAFALQQYSDVLRQAPEVAAYINTMRCIYAISESCANQEYSDNTLMLNQFSPVAAPAGRVVAWERVPGSAVAPTAYTAPERRFIEREI